MVTAFPDEIGLEIGAIAAVDQVSPTALEMIAWRC